MKRREVKQNWISDLLLDNEEFWDRFCEGCDDECEGEKRRLPSCTRHRTYQDILLNCDEMDNDILSEVRHGKACNDW